MEEASWSKSARRAVQHEPSSDLNRDDIIRSGFVPADYSEIVIEISKLSSDIWPQSSVCPPKSGGTATMWESSESAMDLYMSMSQVDTLDDIDTSGGTLGSWVMAVFILFVLPCCCLAGCLSFAFSGSNSKHVERSTEMSVKQRPRPPPPMVHCAPNGMNGMPPPQGPYGHLPPLMGGPPPGYYPPMGPSTPVHPDIACGFIAALWGEYVMGRENGVRYFLEGCPPQDVSVLERYEDQIRATPDHLTAIRGLATSWGLPPPR
mmetsp:Transcript_1914/g.4420  ORF Transcript_1914/g.4420 Transcript_1914/m.4420 type:complete len:262 (-) Transcript_1914:141-926(-)